MFDRLIEQRCEDLARGGSRDRASMAALLDDDHDLVQKARADGFPAIRGNAAAEQVMAEASPAAVGRSSRDAPVDRQRDGSQRAPAHE